MDNFGYIEKNWRELCEETLALAVACNRPAPTVVAVTKSGSDEELLALAECGALDVGENRPGEVLRRGDILREHGYAPRMHEIGTLQRNKVKYIAEKVHLIHSVDSVKLAEEIVDPDDIDNQMAIIVGLARTAMKGDARSAKLLVEMLGESPKDEPNNDQIQQHNALVDAIKNTR